ncbi:glycoside hydrolase family 51 protein [Hypoxylon rubiginosum]|uniref:Glycoside hydrolase family 51 protein n=1 Tax=Hypoxylon rubiginosum TaxID=110542 RepID=A0ACB9ZHE3_9PEZI|nr:glycoside hydrolase family 51 protein [Hypoxylon rubiginosum]
MTTFTKIAGDETPLIEVDAAKRLSKIDPMIYGGFTEHMGRCIYDGIYDPGSPLADAQGFWKDVLAALRELDIPVVRYPGGNFVATYHWQDGVGPRDKRPSRPELAWLGTGTNQFGTEEFMAWLDVLSEGKTQCVESYLCLNFGTGTLDTYYANLRRAHGDPEPYSITKEDYAKKAAQWAKALRLLDPDVRAARPARAPGTTTCSTGASAGSTCTASTSTRRPATHVKNATAPLAAERAIQISAGLINLARIENGISPDGTARQDLLRLDEWNVWDPERASGDKGAEEQNTLSDEHLVAPLWLFSRYTCAAGTVAAHVRPAWLQGALAETGAPWLDASAALGDDGFVNLAVVNISETEDFPVELKGVGTDVSLYVVSGSQLSSTNTEDKEEVGLSEGKWDGKGKYTFPKHTFTLLRWKP